MTTFRPAVEKEDQYVQKVIKYIPAEIVAGYTALIGYLNVTANSDIPDHYIAYYLFLIVILILITPIWTYYAVLDKADPPNPDEDKKRARFHAFIATIAFIVWVLAIGNPLLKILLCNCATPNCPDCLFYSPVLGSILLVLFTLLTPLMERIVLRTKLPTKNESKQTAS